MFNNVCFYHDYWESKGNKVNYCFKDMKIIPCYVCKFCGYKLLIDKEKKEKIMNYEF